MTRLTLIIYNILESWFQHLNTDFDIKNWKKITSFSPNFNDFCILSKLNKNVLRNFPQKIATMSS